MYGLVSSNRYKLAWFRSTCASMQSDQSLWWTLFWYPKVHHFFRRKNKTLNRLCRRTDWFESLRLVHSKEGYKDQELIQSSTTPDPGYQWESDKLTGRHHKRDAESRFKLENSLSMCVRPSAIWAVSACMSVLWISIEYLPASFICWLFLYRSSGGGGGVAWGKFWYWCAAQFFETYPSLQKVTYSYTWLSKMFTYSYTVLWFLYTLFSVCKQSLQINITILVS